MQRHRNDPARAASFEVDLEALLGPNVWERMAVGDAAGWADTQVASPPRVFDSPT